MSDRWIQGYRWCPADKSPQTWDEDLEHGCYFCPAPHEAEHHKLVMARYAEAAWEDNDRLRRRLNVCDRAEVGEPEALAADMLAAYRGAAKAKNLNEQVTNLVEGLARVAVCAIGNARWAHGERDLSDRLAMALRGHPQAIELHKEWAWERALTEKAKVDQQPVSHGQENVGWPPDEAAS